MDYTNKETLGNGATDTHTVLGILVGSSINQQTRAVSVIIRSSAHQRCRSALCAEIVADRPRNRAKDDKCQISETEKEENEQNQSCTERVQTARKHGKKDGMEKL